ncbi:MAG: hypothetical protein IJ460_01890 [Clostridia bacterium]|nr:hypothetical protein [Clostridia bacterium]
MENIPVYWKSGVDDAIEMLKNVKRGKVTAEIRSAGGRPVQLLVYGDKNELNRTANLSCALGAGDKSCYADKSKPDYKPTILIVGCVHGGEFEGTVALLNLISLLETGADLKGEANEFLSKSAERVNILIIPCLNPDGRSRIDFPSFVGKTFEDLRYYNQGTWKDGTLCGWPECKKIHPMKGHCEFLGAYFNDDGVNIMHDDFFGRKANETQFLFDTVDMYSPDYTILLHGGTNTVNCILKPSYAPDAVKEDVTELENAMMAHCESKNLAYHVTPMDRGENKPTPCSFNLTSALYHFSGEPCVTYESNQGLTNCSSPAMTHDEIYRAHMILFEEAIKHIEKKEES